MDVCRSVVALRKGNLSQRERWTSGIPARNFCPAGELFGRSDKQHRETSDEAETPHGGRNSVPTNPLWCRATGTR